MAFLEMSSNLEKYFNAWWNVGCQLALLQQCAQAPSILDRSGHNPLIYHLSMSPASAQVLSCVIHSL